MMRKSHLVCFTGVDGSGKSTHAKSLNKYFVEQGYSCRYVWCAFRPFFAYSFFIFTRILGYWKNTKKNVYTDPLEYAPKPIATRLGKVWRVLLFIDYQMRVLIKIKLPLLSEKVVICDRYFYDIIMELQLSNVSSQSFVSVLSKSLPKPTVTFLMKVPCDQAQNRRDFSKRYFERRDKILQNLSEKFSFIIIDSSQDLHDNQIRIRQEVLKRMKQEEDNR